MRRHTARQIAVFVGGGVGALPGVFLYLSAQFGDATHGGFVDPFLVASVVTAIGAGIGVVIGAIVGTIVMKVQKANARRASLLFLDRAKTARVIETRADDTGLTVDVVRKQLREELGVFQGLLDMWLTGQQKIAPQELERLSRSLDTIPGALLPDDAAVPALSALAGRSKTGPGGWGLFWLALSIIAVLGYVLSLVLPSSSTAAAQLAMGLLVGAVAGLAVGLIAQLGRRSFVAATAGGVATGLVWLIQWAMVTQVWTSGDVPFYIAEDPFTDFLSWLILTLLAGVVARLIVPAVLVTVIVTRLRGRETAGRRPGSDDYVGQRALDGRGEVDGERGRSRGRSGSCGFDSRTRPERNRAGRDGAGST